MTAKERFGSEWKATPQEWENKPFLATAKTDFGAFSEGTGVLLLFKEGEVVDGCLFGRTEWEDKRRWVVRFSKLELLFEISAPDFFKLFEA